MADISSSVDKPTLQFLLSNGFEELLENPDEDDEVAGYTVVTQYIADEMAKGALA
jgi:hypothetical protein